MPMTRADMTAKVLEKKRELELKWSAIADALGSGSPMFYTALLGHQALNKDEARRAGALLELDDASSLMLAEPPEERGATLKMPPTDPLLYRFYELVQGYGPTLKADQRGVRRWDHERDRLQHAPGAGARSQGRSGSDYDVGKFLPYEKF